ncbi:hypothetical protein [Poseidonibacter ostreae]|uniref:Uncharacterized protein n=1 Tax=Poseidonibacter ostreae TaxID=2654171 RepID=A0A6L4WWY1_9BACT|nr:hypothetical protein [Poseidonibacter ostreae]KAB7891448.1 hypothetical protein GBG19_01005 [Poseidonibacter ostreae]
MAKTNSEKNKAFLKAIDSQSKNDILDNIAKHYGITNDEAEDEVTDDEAEHLLDYITGNQRNGAYALMLIHNCM